MNKLPVINCVLFAILETSNAFKIKMEKKKIKQNKKKWEKKKELYMLTQAAVMLFKQTIS